MSITFEVKDKKFERATFEDKEFKFQPLSEFLEQEDLRVKVTQVYDQEMSFVAVLYTEGPRLQTELGVGIGRSIDGALESLCRLVSQQRIQVANIEKTGEKSGEVSAPRIIRVPILSQDLTWTAKE